MPTKSEFRGSNLSITSISCFTVLAARFTMRLPFAGIDSRQAFVNSTLSMNSQKSFRKELICTMFWTACSPRICKMQYIRIM